jgi:hypothetical protein
VFFELGLNKGGQLRADVLSMSMRGEIIIVEVKSCAADLLADKKLLGYQPFCHKMYVAIPSDAKVSTELKELQAHGIGVFLMEPSGKKITRVLPAATGQVPEDLVQAIAIRGAFRQSDSSTRKNKI